MKNSELLTVQRRNLTPTEKQQQFVLRSLIQQNACPNCGHRLNFFEGAAIDLDDWEDKSGLTACKCTDRKSTRLNSSHLGISYAVFCLKKKKRIMSFIIARKNNTITKELI